MTKLEELKAARDAAWDAAWDAALVDEAKTRAAIAATWEVADAAYWAELKKTQEENSDD